MKKKDDLEKRGGLNRIDDLEEWGDLEEVTDLEENIYPTFFLFENFPA